MARLVRLRELSTDTGLSKWTLARMEAAGEFPKRIKIGKYAIAWDADEIAEWKAERKAARRAATAEHERRAQA